MICIICIIYRFNGLLCYKLVSEPGRSCPEQHWVIFPVCVRHVRKYCRYLLCCSVLLGGFERSKGEVGCFRCVGSGKGMYLLDGGA